jgi:hypothetical protein
MENVGDRDRAFLDENFKRFGTAWDGGLSDLEAQYHVRIEKTKNAYELHLRHRSPAAVSFVVTVERDDGGMSNTGAQLPDARVLSPEELVRVDEVLLSKKSLWLLEPLNRKVVRLNLRNGAEALASDPSLMEVYFDGQERRIPRKLDSRMLDGIAVLYFLNSSLSGSLFCVALDLVQGCIVDVVYVDLPPEKFKLLAPDEKKFLDQSLKKHGDFGVYGNLKKGFGDLVRYFEVRINEDEKDYFLSASPKDGHGHFFDMTINKASGEIRDVFSGHEIPAEEWDDMSSEVIEEP